MVLKQFEFFVIYLQPLKLGGFVLIRGRSDYVV